MPGSIRATACYSPQLCNDIARVIRPFLSDRAGVVPFLTWEKELLEPKLVWPVPSSRVEDHAGSCSTASWSQPPGASAKRGSGDFLPRFRANLASGAKTPPTPEEDLRPFLGDLRTFLQVSEVDFETLLTVPPGQPFRLFLLEALLTLSKDLDSSFVDLLVQSVPLPPRPLRPTWTFSTVNLRGGLRPQCGRGLQRPRSDRTHVVAE